MRKLKKIIALTMCASILMAGNVAAADEIIETKRLFPGDKWTVEDADGKGNDKDYDIPKDFSKKWSRSIQWVFEEEGGYVYNACLATIGFDTWCTDEDYIKSVCGTGTYDACGAVKNSKGTWSGDTSWGNSGKKSNKKDVKHTGSSVTYWLALGIEDED